MPAVEAIRLMTPHQWREGDVALLEAAPARFGSASARPMTVAEAGHVGRRAPRASFRVVAMLSRVT
jgi:hypothetical protein